MRSKLVAAVACAVLYGLVPALPVAWATPEPEVRITFFSFGYGDAAIYEGPCGERGLVDAGDGSREEILAYLDRTGSRSLRWVSPSHYDADHLGDVVDVATAPGASVGAVYDRGGDRNEKDTDTYRRYFDWATSGATTRAPVDIGAQFGLCSGEESVLFEVVSAGTDGTAARGVAVTEENDRGLCLKVTYRSFNAATCGDVNGTDEASRTNVEAAVAPAFGDVEFAKVNHHGSRFSSTPAYVQTLAAQASVISVGPNSFGHPDAGVVARWDAHGDVYQTTSADVVVTSDGTTHFAVQRFTADTGVSRHYELDGGPPLPGSSSGYWLVGSDGGVFGFGQANFFGSTGGIRLNQPVVCMASTPSANGYWLVGGDGGVFSFGDGGFHGSTGALRLTRPVVGMASTPSGAGYWLVASDGGMFSFGDSGFFGSTGNLRLNQPIVGMASTPSGAGYWLVASDGGIFSFGDAGFFGSTGNLRLNQPIVGMAATSTGNGYWLVASDGGIFSFGDAAFFGSTGNLTLTQPIVGMSATTAGGGYWLGAADGGIFSFGDAAFEGSLGGTTLNAPVVGIAGLGRPGSCRALAQAPSRASQPMSAPAPPSTPNDTTGTSRCDPAYPSVCIPPPPPDLDCPDIPHRNFAVRPPDPHGFDGNNNGVGCER